MLDDTEDNDYAPIEKVEKKNSLKSLTMSALLTARVNNYTELQKRYAEYRAKGFKMADSAQKAGSKATGRGGLSRTGWQFEQLEGMKEYITYLHEKRARASVLDEVELVEYLREQRRLAISNNKISDANKAVELLALMCGAIGVKSAKQEKLEKVDKSKGNSKNNINAFKDEDLEPESNKRLKAITELLREVDRRDTSKVEDSSNNVTNN